MRILEINPAQNGTPYQLTGDSLFLMSSNNCLPIKLDTVAPSVNTPLTVSFGDDTTVFPLLFNTVYRFPFHKLTLTTPFENDGITKFYLCYGESRAFPVVSLQRAPMFYHYHYVGNLVIGSSVTSTLYPQVMPTASWYRPARSANVSLNLAVPDMNVIFYPLAADATRLGTAFEGTAGSALIAGTVARQGKIGLGHWVRQIDIVNNVAASRTVNVSIMAEIG